MLPKGCISMVFSTKHHIVQGLSKGISGQDRVRSSQQMGKGIYLFHVWIGIGHWAVHCQAGAFGHMATSLRVRH